MWMELSNSQRPLHRRLPPDSISTLIDKTSKRLARYPQLYSRVGFVHEFRPLSVEEVHDLFSQRWVPAGVVLPAEGLTDAEVLATIIRITGGNFRLLHRLLTQIARLVEINALSQVTREVVEAARESLVIGAI
jgi:DNA transposition AAA+ family ATPase